MKAAEMIMADADRDDIFKNGSEPNVPPAPQPQQAPVPAAESEARIIEETITPAAGALGDDIAKILKDMKLPERRDVTLPGEQRAERDVRTFDTNLGAAAETPAAAAVEETPSIVTPQSGEKHATSITPVHTLKDDLRDVVHDKKISLVSAVSLEEKRRARRAAGPQETPANMQRSKRTFAILFTVLLLCVLGGGALFGVYTVMQRQSAPPPAALTSSSILFAEQSLVLPIANQSPSDLKQTLAAARNSSTGNLGSITRIIPAIIATSSNGTVQTRPATFGEFMAAIGAHPSDDLIRALGSDFFFGFHTVDTNAPLFVIPVTSYDHAFAGMLAWESTMNDDLTPIFTGVPDLTTDQNGLPVERTFQDVVMRNYDVRALKDDAGDIELYYSFPTQSILVIAESPYSFTEILSRLQAGREL
jgi:hypothetical protein